MLDTYVPEPFDGLSKFKKLCKSLEEPKEPLPASEPIEKVTILPRTGLYDIYKRTTNLSTNKCVGIGFTYEDAKQFIEKRLRTTVDNKIDVITFYDIVAQDNELAKNPLWNPKEIVQENVN